MPRDPTTSYLPIADYGLVGDMISAALVGRDGSIDWCCWPRFDSPAFFYRLLDAASGGYFQICPDADFESERRYLRGTNVLETTFTTPGGRVTLTDYMPLRDGGPHDRAPAAPQTTSSIMRRIECVDGEVDMRVAVRCGFDWGREPAELSRTDYGIEAVAGGVGVAVVCPVELEEHDGTLSGVATLAEGDVAWVAVHHLSDPGAKPPLQGTPAAQLELERTIEFWRKWLARCSYDGPYADLVHRSALVLKLLTYAPSGAVIAAPTTSLPETLGGTRNWDYRFVWLRDAALTLRELQDLGYFDEALAFWDWLEALEMTEARDNQNLYRIDGSTDMPEVTLDHLDGYCGSKPVRIGNAATRQLQLDNYGYILESAYLCQTRLREPNPDLRPILAALTDRVVERWGEPDQGIWEIRGEPRQYVHSKVRCWVALDRAIRLAERGWLEGDIDQWRRSRQELREFIESKGYNADIGSFTQSVDSEHLDATALMFPLLGFLPADDPRVTSTIEQVRQRLSVDGFIRRYEGDDGLPGAEGAFVMCSFWLVSALAHSGEKEEARALFEDLCACASDLGLFAEEFDPHARRFLGNFPQAFSHLAVIDAALALQ